MDLSDILIAKRIEVDELSSLLGRVCSLQSLHLVEDLELTTDRGEMNNPNILNNVRGEAWGLVTYREEGRFKTSLSLYGCHIASSQRWDLSRELGCEIAWDTGEDVPPMVWTVVYPDGVEQKETVQE